MMRENQLLAVQEWPEYCGGGVPATCMIDTHILRILNVPYTHEVYAKDSETIASDLAKADIIHLTLNSLRYLTPEHIPIAVSLMSRLVFTAEHSK